MGNLALNFVNHSVLHIDFGLIMVGMITNISDYEDADYLLNDNVFSIEMRHNILKCFLDIVKSVTDCTVVGVIEILPEFRAWFFGMDETDFTPFADQIGKSAQERTLADIQILYVGSSDPKVFFHVCNAGYDFLEVRFVCDVLYHT